MLHTSTRYTFTHGWVAEGEQVDFGAHVVAFVAHIDDEAVETVEEGAMVVTVEGAMLDDVVATNSK